MIIAVNLTHFVSEVNSGSFFTLFEKLAISKPEHQFIFICKKDPAALKVLANVRVVVSRPRLSVVFFWKIWYNFTLPSLAKKYNASVLINVDGACSLRSKLPQYLFINELYFSNALEFSSGKQAGFVQKNAAAFLNKATAIVVGSQSQKNHLIDHYKIGEEKTKVLSLGPGEIYQPAGFLVKEKTKEIYSEEKEYFLFSGEIHPRNNLVNLLKAFSFFKKRQKSNMQLLLLTTDDSETAKFLESLKTYKYRNEVKVYSGLAENEAAKIISAAYAFVYPGSGEVFLFHPLMAIQCEVPLILTGTLKETAGDAALYVDPSNYKDIADKMMLLFKDENLRNQLIKATKVLSLQQSTTQPVELVWKTITS